MNFNLTMYLAMGIAMWAMAIFINKNMISEINTNSTWEIIAFTGIQYMLFFLVVLLFAFGLVVILSSLTFMISDIAVKLYSYISPEGTIEYKDCLSTVVTIFTILGSVMTGSFAYIFGKSNKDDISKIKKTVTEIYKNNPKKRLR
ncbi:hypothetical protein [Thomasclavelia ramosa]|uniref:Uncharacterized protein n=1 Tax=Thomasclavelia ramosa TaxID=1547 RepID=A0A3E3EFP7_9FIRM|nr:hypothetical protein [Thomasclavelia ramosa]RGD86730.1 hypothetical protein DXB93_04265 [Thomasclavelia ramosa]